MHHDVFPEDLDFPPSIPIPRFGPGQGIFRRYTLQKIIGRGGMGVVWLAHDEELDRRVALKVLPETLVHDSASLDSLRRETKVGLDLAHPNIVRIYDFHNDAFAAAISMEYVDGGNLSDLRIKREHQVLSVADLSKWINPLLDALEYAHIRPRIVHRDLKPRNLMLNTRGELKIADFGISRSISDSMTLLTGNLDSSGSPPYISPQQWDGQRATPLDDIYSLGATLYELLTSKPPLLGVVDWQQVHHKVAPPMWQRRIDLGIKAPDTIPPEWEETIAACLAKKPKDRPQTVGELKARLLINGVQPLALSEVSADNGHNKRSPAEENAGVTGDVDEKTIDGRTVVDRSSEATSREHDCLFDEPTLREVKASPPQRHLSEDIETDATIQNARADEELRPLPSVAKLRRIPVWFWLSASATCLFVALAYLVFGSGMPVISPPPSVQRDMRVQGVSPAATPTSEADVVVETRTIEGSHDGSHQLEQKHENEKSQEPAPTAAVQTASPQEVENPARLGQTDSADPTARQSQEAPAAAEQVQELPSSEQLVSLTNEPAGARVSPRTNPPNEAPSLYTQVPPETPVAVSPQAEQPALDEVQANSSTPVSSDQRLEPTEESLRLQKLLKYRDVSDSPEKVEAYTDYFVALSFSTSESQSLPVIDPRELRQEFEEMIQRLRAELSLMRRSESRQEFKKYEESIRRAVEFDSSQATLMLAEHETDWRSKVDLFGRVSADPHAMMMLGHLYYKRGNEDNSTDDYRKALEWLEKAKNAGSKEAAAYYYAAYLFVNAGVQRSDSEKKAAVASLEELARQGVPQAQVALGVWCRHSAMATNDKARKLKLYHEAAYWWNEAKGAREWTACSYLGGLHESGSLNANGRPTANDLDKARALYQTAADNEDLTGTYTLGRILWSQARTVEERKGALAWITKASNENYKPASEWLAKNKLKLR